jgi:hypothetical protein
MRGRFLRPIAVEVRCTRQSPPMRGRFLRPLVVEVRCTRQSPPMRGRSAAIVANSPLHVTKSSIEGQLLGGFLANDLRKMHSLYRSF